MKLTDIPKKVIKEANKKLEQIKKLDVPVTVKKAMIIDMIAKPLIPLVRKKYNEKMAKNLKGSGLKLAGQRLSGSGVSDAAILKKLKL